MEEFNFFEHKELVVAFQKAKPYVVDLEKLVKAVGFGKLDIIFTIQDGTVISIDIIGRQKIRYDKGSRIDQGSYNLVKQKGGENEK